MKFTNLRRSMFLILTLVVFTLLLSPSAFALTTIFEDNFTSSGGFQNDTPNTAPWQLGNATQVSGCYSASSCWGTNLTSNYYSSGPYDDYLTQVNAMNFSKYTNITLTFYHYRYFESASTLWDAGVVDINYNGSWTRLTPVGGYNGTVSGIAGSTLANQQAYGYHGTGWELATFNLSSYAGNNSIKLRFHFATDQATSDRGWFIDNVKLTGFDSNPSPVANLANQSRDESWIYWNWTNPSDTDFNQSIIYKNGVNVANTTNNYYNMTGLTDGTSYTITIHTKDDAGNVNDTDVNSTVSTIVTLPAVTAIIPTANTEFNVDVTIEISANTTDSTNVSTVYANITFPNSTIQQLTLSQVGSTKQYNTSFAIPTLKGIYNISIFANDTFGNINSSETSYFNVSNTYPNITNLSYPSNNANLNISKIDFNFTVTDDNDAVVSNCSLYTNSSGTFAVEQTVYNITNNTETNITVTLADEDYLWNVECTDSGGISKFFASNYTLTVDTAFNGLIVYEELNVQIPRHRIYSNTNIFGNEKATATTVSGDIAWVVNKANHERNEFIAGFEDKNDDINLQVFNATTETWGNLLEVTADVPNSAYRSFDIAYEDVSGDALIVYEDSTVAENTLKYRIWNGTAYSSEQSVTTGLSADGIRWVSLVKEQGTDYIMLLAHNSLNESYAIPWNGTDFDSAMELTASTSTTSSTEQHFSFAWEESSGEGLLVYGEGTNLVYRTFKKIAPQWSTEATIALGDGLDGARTCSDPTSDYIGVIWQDSGKDVQARMWDGSTFLTSPPTEDNKTEGHGGNNVNVDCAWTNSSTALFGFIDRNLLSMDYFTFTKSNTWSTSSLDSTDNTGNFASEDIKGIRFIRNPSTNEIMITVSDTLEDISLIRWNGTAFVNFANSTIETNTEVTNSGQEDVMFAWLSLDYTPNVTNVSPSSATVTAGNSVLVNATISDDNTIDTVLANITFPNGTIQQLTLADGDSDSVYNATFTETTLPGVYTIKIIANDTSTHKNINSSETSTFTVPDTSSPTVTNTIPTASTNYNVSENIEIAVNISDPSNISSASVNITYPNGTVQELSLTNTTSSKYNTSFTVPGLLGTYNITFFANDTLNNINGSETTNFTAVDNIPPEVTALIPSQGTPVTALDVVEVSANVTDGLNVNVTLANVTYPNGTVLELTLTNAGGNKYNSSFVIPNLAGTFNITFFANDSNGNINSSETTFVDSSGDSENPQVTALIPANGSSINVSSSIEIATNVTDNIYLEDVLVNLTHPNGTIEELTLTSATGSKYNISYTLSTSLGTYTAVFFANDTSGNINGSEQTVFTTVDSGLPSITTLGCVPNPVALTQSTICNATITDDGALDTVSANVTYPNGTIETQSVSNVNSNYYFTFTNSVTNGSHTVTWFANDTGGNSKTASETFSVADQTNPKLALNGPSNLTNITTTSQTFNFTASDNYDSTLSCSIYLDSVLNQTNSSTANNTATLFTVTGLTEGTYTWNVTCSDGAGNSNTSEARTLKVDINSPTFNTLTTSPSSSADLDPNVNITVSANVTENVTNVDTVILQTKTTSESTYTNTTMVYNTSTSLYVATFNATNETTYNIRLYANDTMGHSGFSTVVNRTIQIDKTWTISPSSFTPVNVGTNVSSSVGNLVINNTGDVNLNFSITSSSSNTLYNDTANFNLTVGAVKVLAVNDSVPVGGVSRYTITVSSNTSGANPSSQTTTETLVVTEQPTLISEITTPVSESINRTQGDANVAFTASLTNAGNKTASDVTQTFTIPNDWTLTFGSLSNSVGTLTANTTEEFTIEVTIPSNATLGSRTVTANATGTNTSGTDIATLGFIFGDTVTVNVDSGATETISSGSSSSSSSSGAGSGGSSGGSGSPSGSVSVGGSFSSSKEGIEVVRGKNTTIEIPVTNNYPNSTLVNLTPQAFGDLGEFVTFTPSKIDELPFSETVYFTALIAPPSYLNQEDYSLSVKVKASILVGDVTRSFSKTILYNIFVREMSSAEASKYLNESTADVVAMINANFTTKRIQLLLDSMQEAFSIKDFAKLRELKKGIHQRRVNAFNVFELFEEIENSIQKSESSGIPIPRTRELFSLAKAAFDREDYKTALQRAKDTQLSVLLESKGRFDMISFLIDWWWAVILGLITSVFVALIVYKRMFTAFVKQRIANLNKEEETLKILLKEAQKKHFEKGEISSQDYKQMTAQYKTRLIKISQIRNKLRHKRARVVRTESEIKQLESEGKEIVQMIKKLQVKYYRDRSITPNEYQMGLKSNESALAELEDERATLESRISKEIGTYRYKILRFVQEKILGRNSNKKNSKLSDREIRRELKKKLKGRWVKIKGRNDGK